MTEPPVALFAERGAGPALAPRTPPRRIGGRICVVGNAGAGKSFMARSLARGLGLRYLDRDALVWREGWTATPREERPALFEAATRKGGWTYDGHLRADRPEEQLVLARCDTIVWLDLPRWRVLASVAGRSLRRALTREPGPNGNREGWRMLFDREFGVHWAWRSHSRLRREYGELFDSPVSSPRVLVRLRSRAEANRWLAGVPRPGPTS